MSCREFVIHLIDQQSRVEGERKGLLPALPCHGKLSLTIELGKNGNSNVQKACT